jgi:hypothetical protein
MSQKFESETFWAAFGALVAFAALVSRDARERRCHLAVVCGWPGGTCWWGPGQRFAHWQMRAAHRLHPAKLCFPCRSKHFCGLARCRSRATVLQLEKAIRYRTYASAPMHRRPVGPTRKQPNTEFVG